MTKPAKRPHYTTPEGTAVFPRLNKPDEKFVDEKTKVGKYTVKLKLTKAQAEPIIKLIDAATEADYQRECKEQGKVKIKRSPNIPYKAEEDDQGNETGYVLFNFSKKGAFLDRESKQIVMTKLPLYDKAGKAVTEEIWGGSRIQIAYDLRPYFTGGLGHGMSLGLKAVRVVELVTKGSGGAAGGAESFGFAIEKSDDVEEFAAPEATATTEGTTNASASGDF